MNHSEQKINRLQMQIRDLKASSIGITPEGLYLFLLRSSTLVTCIIISRTPLSTKYFFKHSSQSERIKIC